MDKAKTEDALLTMGVPAGIKGFAYIVDAVEYIDKYGTNVSVTKGLYPAVAKKNNTTSSRVERAIRHAFEVARSSKGDYEVVERYIGFMNCANFSSLVMLHKRIKQECNLEQEDTKKDNDIIENTTSITTLEVREIFRQELKMFLNDLKDELTKTDI